MTIHFHICCVGSFQLLSLVGKKNDRTFSSNEMALVSALTTIMVDCSPLGQFWMRKWLGPFIVLFDLSKWKRRFCVTAKLIHTNQMPYWTCTVFCDFIVQQVAVNGIQLLPFFTRSAPDRAHPFHFSTSHGLGHMVIALWKKKKKRFEMQSDYSTETRWMLFATHVRTRKREYINSRWK